VIASEVDKFEHKVWGEHKKADNLGALCEKRRDILSTKYDTLEQLRKEAATLKHNELNLITNASRAKRDMLCVTTSQVSIHKLDNLCIVCYCLLPPPPPLHL
jgi:hypothetical protein